MLDREFSSFISGVPLLSGRRTTVRFPANGDIVSEVSVASLDDAESAISEVASAAGGMRRLPAWRRSEILRAASEIVGQQVDAIASILVLETGKPMREARVEVARASSTLLIGAEEARRLGGEIVPIDGLPAGEGRLAEVRRFPVGPVVGITPFNSPFNLAAHKVAGAMAAGCPLILKPSMRTPLTTIILGEIALEAGWPRDALAVLIAGADVGEALVRDPRIAGVAFNGAVDVGWRVREIAGAKRVLLELGGNGAVIVDATADVKRAAERCVEAGYLLAGQVCASVQRIYVDRAVIGAFTEELVRLTKEQVMGDPRSEATTLGPLITAEEARRVGDLVGRAIGAGAELLTGGGTDGAYMEPTILASVSPEMEVVSNEVFGPVLTLTAFDDLDQAIELVNDSPYGMQTGVFTSTLDTAYRAYRELDVAGVIINDVNGYRTDAMPFGGEKMSGLGREGPAAILDTFTYPKLLVLNLGVH